MRIEHIALWTTDLERCKQFFGSAHGCIKGAVVGGVVGHVAGHHAVAGAAVGCVIGHHHAKVKEREAAAAQSQDSAAISTGATAVR